MDTRHMNNGCAAFVIPFWSDGKPQRLKYLNNAIESIFEQTDENWYIYIIDDASPCAEVKNTLQDMANKDNRIKVIFSECNLGPGAARNKGIRRAYQDKCPFICFLDSDDIASKNRVEEVRNIFVKDPETSIVYSSFIIIDEENQRVSEESLIEGIKILLNSIESDPLEGYDVWIQVATERDNLIIPSSLNVKTELAISHLFPEYARFHEDTHTWLRYSASGAKVKYSPDIPSLYRIPQKSVGSESRERAGGIEKFNIMRSEIIMQGLEDAIKLAIKRDVINEDKSLEIKTRFLLNVASMVKKEEGTIEVGKQLVQKAENISAKHFSLFKDKYDLNGLLDK